MPACDGVMRVLTPRSESPVADSATFLTSPGAVAA